MSKSLLGRVITAVGVVLGLLGISLAAVSATAVSATIGDGSAVFSFLHVSVNWANDGTVFAFLLVTLSTASLAASIEDNPAVERAAAAMGTAAFGFFLFVPATLAFSHFGFVDSGAWLGLCAVLIPIGGLITWSAAHAPGARSTPAPEGGGPMPRDPAFFMALAGLILVVVGIWLPAGSGSGADSFWNLSSSGHALGILMLLLVVICALLLARAGTSSRQIINDAGLLATATTFGLVEASLIAAAFENFGSLGSGGWLQAIGGFFLLIGGVRLTSWQRAQTGAAVPAGAAAG